MSAAGVLQGRYHANGNLLNVTSAKGRLPMHSYATLALFTLLAGDFWRNLLSWWGWGALAFVIVIASIAVLVRTKPMLSARHLPKPLVLFLALAVLSTAWSFYPGATLIGLAALLSTTIVGVTLALCLSWYEVVRCLAAALRWTLALSMVFEFVVAAFVRAPILPFFTDYSNYVGKIPGAFYWSRGLLFSGGPIGGITGNRNLLAMIALIAIIVFAMQMATKLVSRSWAIAWLALAVGVFLLSRSSTVIVAAVITAAVLGLALWARRTSTQAHSSVYLTAVGVLTAAIIGVIALEDSLLGLFGKNDDLTGRVDIWASVVGLAGQRPAFGWGWVGYWVPWVQPFSDLAKREGVTYLQAHNAWLDVWMQLGVVGLVLFLAVVAGVLWRSWGQAIHRPWPRLANDLPYTATSMLPLLIVTALFVQSLAESRILVESGWGLLIVFALVTKGTNPVTPSYARTTHFYP